MKNLKRLATVFAMLAAFDFASCSGNKDFVKVKGATITESVEDSEVFDMDIAWGGKISVSDIYVCDHEVTQKEYETYCDYGGTQPSEELGKGENYPVYAVNWYDAIIYCNLRSIAEKLTPVYKVNNETNPANWPNIKGENGKYHGPDTNAEAREVFKGGIVRDEEADGYRLPTEKEWEYAARGGNAGIPKPQYAYSGSDTIDDVAWHEGNSAWKPHEVKGKAPNSLGLYDMSGNIAELCDSNYFTKNLFMGQWNPSISGNENVVRGGDFMRGGWACMLSLGRDPVNFETRGTRFGFRVVRSVIEKKKK